MAGCHHHLLGLGRCDKALGAGDGLPFDLLLLRHLPELRETFFQHAALRVLEVALSTRIVNCL